MMFMNIHDLPADKSFYVLYVGPKGTPFEALEEVDVVAPAHAPHPSYLTSLVILTAKDIMLDSYGPTVEVWGVVNQSCGHIMYDSRLQGYRPIPVVPPARLAEAYYPEAYDGRQTIPYDVVIDLCGDAHDGMGGDDYLDFLLGG